MFKKPEKTCIEKRNEKSLLFNPKKGGKGHLFYSADKRGILKTTVIKNDLGPLDDIAVGIEIMKKAGAFKNVQFAIDAHRRRITCVIDKYNAAFIHFDAILERIKETGNDDWTIGLCVDAFGYWWSDK